VLAGTSGGSVLSYSLASDELRLAVDTEHQDIACISTTASDDVVLSCSWGSGDIIAHDLHTGRALACGVGHERFCRSLEGDPTNAAIVLSSSYDASVRLWDLRSAATEASRDDPFGVPTASASRGTTIGCALTLRGHTASVTAAHFLPGDSHYVLSTLAIARLSESK
jgi:WD40 repeat protein